MFTVLTCFLNLKIFLKLIDETMLAGKHLIPQSSYFGTKIDQVLFQVYLENQ